MSYDNTNRGAIWPNKDKQSDTHPDFNGSLNVDGKEFWVSAWKKKQGANEKAPSLSFTIKPKEEKQQEQSKQQKDDQFFDDDLGF
jgi:hypothetical protein